MWHKGNDVVIALLSSTTPLIVTSGGFIYRENMKTRVISTEIWDEDAVFSLNIDTKLLYLILLTNPYIGQSRFYKINDRQLSTFSGLNVEQIQKCKRDLEESGMAYFKSGFVCVTGYGFVECFYRGDKNEVAKAKEIANIPEDVINFFNDKLQSLGILEKENRKENVLGKVRYGRKKMTNTRRERLFNLLGRTCSICNTTDGLLELDHIIPLSLSGLDIDENIQVLCKVCHRIKTTNDLHQLSDTLSEISDTTINHKSEILNHKSGIINQESGTIQDTLKLTNHVTGDDVPIPDSIQIGRIIQEFESINPACKKFYGNITQRKAVSDLLDTHGYERIVFLLREVLPKSNKTPFFPNITTPVQLRDKYATLENAIYKHKQSTNKEKYKII